MDLPKRGPKRSSFERERDLYLTTQLYLKGQTQVEIAEDLNVSREQIKWVISFADATQCGDGTIYRGSGFVLTGIRKNNQIWIMPDGEVATSRVATDTRRPERKRLLSQLRVTKGQHITETGGASMQPFIDAGAKPLDGHQLRYIYFIDPTYRQRLTVPELPYSEIDRLGAGMYKGVKRADEATKGATSDQLEKGGANPTHPLLTR